MPGLESLKFSAGVRSPELQLLSDGVSMFRLIFLSVGSFGFGLCLLSATFFVPCQPSVAFSQLLTGKIGELYNCPSAWE